MDKNWKLDKIEKWTKIKKIRQKIGKFGKIDKWQKFSFLKINYLWASSMTMYFQLNFLKTDFSRSNIS